MPKKQLLISFSGGRTSAYMAKMLLEQLSEEWDIVVVFANTGRELEQTLEFVHECDTRWRFNTVWVEAITNPTLGKGTRAKVVDYETASRNGEPFEAMIAKLGIPNTQAAMCTRDLKRYTISAYARAIGWRGYTTAIGIRSDEFDRISPRAAKDRYVYPLVKAGVTKGVINEFWSRQPFDLMLKSYEGNCDLCFKKSLRKLLTIITERPQVAEWWDRMEQQYSYYVPASRKGNPNIKLPQYFFRNNLSVRDLIKLSQLPFNKAGDDSKIIPIEDTQLSLFDLDASNGCSESCEVF